jgi:GNAT superfamily N-acetyltransferase
MTKAQIDLEMRPATLDDAEMVADLESARDPDEQRDPAMLRFWWTVRPPDEVVVRKVAERDGSAWAFLYASHLPWESMPRRYGSMRLALHPDFWNKARYEQLIDAAESWVSDEGGEVGVARVRETFMDEIGMLERRGYEEVRRARQWELNLVTRRDQLLAGSEKGREQMASQGVRMLTLDRETDPNGLTKLYEMSVAAQQDIPTTVPIPVMPFEEWRHLFFDNPATRPDRFWIAREGNAVVGMSTIEYPPTRGVPWTAFTATARSVRGRGIARALKYESVRQAIELGAERIRTQNDGANAPILHINAEMGYEPIVPVVELHRELPK